MGRRSGHRLLVALLTCLPIASTSTLADTRRPKNVQAALRAKWSSTPLLLEAGELLSKQQQHLFWKFIDIWLNADAADDINDAHFHTAKDCVKKIVQDGRPLLREPLASLFEFSLILRSASPTLVLYRQLALDSLSSFPLTHHDHEILETKNNAQLDPLRVGVILESPGGNCCWVDTGVGTPTTLAHHFSEAPASFFVSLIPYCAASLFCQLVAVSNTNALTHKLATSTKFNPSTSARFLLRK